MRIGRLEHRGVQLLCTLLGTAIFALGIYYFTAPHRIAPGGVSGLSTVLSYWTGIPLGVVSAALNIPLLIVAFFRLGRWFCVKTLCSVVLFTVLYDAVYRFLPVYTGERLLAAVFGGVLIGAGVGITFLGGACSGGMDIINKILQQKFPHLKLGTLVFLSDIAVVALSTVAFADLDATIYALVTMFFSARSLDFVLYGLDHRAFVVVITSKGEEVTRQILQELQRGVTRLHSYGGYSGQANQTLLCAVRRVEYVKLRRLVYGVDHGAFMIVTTASEVYGDGFADHFGSP